MTQLHELLPGVYALVVPMDANTFEINKEYDSLLFYEGKPSFGSFRDRPLPPGNWSILCCSATATEEEAGKVVEVSQPKVRGAKVQVAFYKNYETPSISFGGAVPSLLSLIRSNGLDPAKNWLFLKLEI